ncbi:alginate lyase family protein [Lutimonas zeaxanthinifaciens]|uniref:alginate lyase family protein n=1 Tax=Lutimonas zeaxanthinifaciens TaxID=3060215 RepID=UPI00265CEFD4|nr:alginate lyase family protein [Lutimonas sp. YSD2104]WKK67366.1 alginate lyase family protein [Lutimonas sp. YSD2104]
MVKTKLGIIESKFPTEPELKTFISLDRWRQETPLFFFQDRSDILLSKKKSTQLEKSLEEIMSGTYTFFSNLKFELGMDYDWVTNPDTKYKYDINKHFSKIEDLSKTAGDIKYVWEKSRFSFLYEIIRYDYNYDEDHSEFVFDQIIDFIERNPINQGPNYKCSQEISLRILNWTFAIYFYKNSPLLDDKRFELILNSIYWQLDHVYKNINFSRIAVRNNHAITEALMLFLSNKLFPFIPESKKWSVEGKKWFEEEICYQIYDDGTYLQFSMNYHRVVVQLLTWGIRFSEIHNDPFESKVYDRAEKSLHFLTTCLNKENGRLPNYGSNDGALFFKLTNDDYRDYRSQLDDLSVVLKKGAKFNTESYHWYGLREKKKEQLNTEVLNSFEKGGYYIINEPESKTFLRCGGYKDRPHQADNLHLDLWVNGRNYVWDSGTYKYNTDKELSNYFTGTEGHNTLSVNGKNQMLKGNRFIWFNWVKNIHAKLSKDKGEFQFEGGINAFKECGSNIWHYRKVNKQEGRFVWSIEDEVLGIEYPQLTLYWHINPGCESKITFEVINDTGDQIHPVIEEKWVSNYYGSKEKSMRLTYNSQSTKLFSTIRINP